MDIAIDKNIGYGELKRFLDAQFPCLDFFLIYEGLNDWDDVQEEKVMFQYFENKGIEQGFKYCLCVYIKNDNALPLIERLSSEFSGYFGCSTFCDASRVVLKERNPYYSLLFERGKVYLVDDYIYEETGNVTKVVELTYESPEYGLD